MYNTIGIKIKLGHFEDENFKNLAADYQLCIDTLKGLENETSKNQAWINEYLELKKELEKEALKYLIKAK